VIDVLPLIALDVECYPGFFCVVMSDGQKTRTFREQRDAPAVIKILRERETLSFNGLRYDLPMIMAWADGGINLYQYSGELILEDARPPKAPDDWRHIDIYAVAPGVGVSLKLYGGRMGTERLQDLPYPPDTRLTADQQDEVIEYCQNDVRVLLELYGCLRQQVDLRRSMSEQYGINLMSLGDAQIAERVLLHEIGQTAHATKPSDAGRYRAPEWLHYHTPVLQRLLDRVLQPVFCFDKSGSLIVPDEIREPIVINNAVYRLGVGGLHSSETRRTLTSGDRVLIDIDVASYYPSIILEQRLYPPQCGERFLDVYQSIVTRRLEAKRTGNTVVAESLKICVNGSFGKLNSSYSRLYAPELFKQVTITGQLALLMLIESLEEDGIEVVSANTDGIVAYPRQDQIPALQSHVGLWESITGYSMESTQYRSLHSRDVNNYLAVKLDGKVKIKGVYAPPGLMKNPQMPVISAAVVQHLSAGADIEQTIRSTTDPREFCSVRTVKGGGEWCGEYLGKVVRWYWAKNGYPITYRSNGNRVPTSDGCRPLMQIREIDDIDYDRYVRAAYNMMEDLGCMPIKSGHLNTLAIDQEPRSGWDAGQGKLW
jgi:hypothetical protein